jgi:hypothetical protein
MMEKVELADPAYRPVCAICGEDADDAVPRTLTIGHSADTVSLAGILLLCAAHRRDDWAVGEIASRLTMALHNL